MVNNFSVFENCLNKYDGWDCNGLNSGVISSLEAWSILVVFVIKACLTGELWYPIKVYKQCAARGR